MYSAIQEYVPETWSTSRDRVEVSKYTEEFRQVDYELRQASSSSYPIRRLIRVQSVHSFGQFLIREQLLLNDSSSSLYRVRRYIQVSKSYEDAIVKYNLDYRRCGLSSLSFQKSLDYINTSQLLKMDQDFLRKEEEFRKENKQLEIKTKEILQKVDDIMVKKLQDFQLEDNFRSKQQDMRLLEKTETRDLNLPKSVDEMGTRGMLHFYKGKIKALQTDVEKLQNEVKSKNEELKKLQKNHHTVSEEKEKWFLQYNLEKNNSAKLEKQITACNSKLQLKENENAVLKKENEQLKSDLKNSCNELSASENRFKRACQDIEKHKATIKTLRQEEKETKETYKNNLKDLTGTVKQIQKHKNELLQGYKKQIQLIDNLKKQKAHVESCKVLELAENEFFKLLDWKME